MILNGRDKLKCICKKVVKINIVLVELLDLIATVITATRIPNHAPIKWSQTVITGITKLETPTTKKAYQTQSSGKVPSKKATATSAEKLDEAVKQGKWFGDGHIDEAMKMIQSQFPTVY